MTLVLNFEVYFTWMIYVVFHYLESVLFMPMLELAYKLNLGNLTLEKEELRKDDPICDPTSG